MQFLWSPCFPYRACQGSVGRATELPGCRHLSMVSGSLTTRSCINVYIYIIVSNGSKRFALNGGGLVWSCLRANDALHRRQKASNSGAAACWLEACGVPLRIPPQKAQTENWQTNSHAEHTASIGGWVIHLRVTFQYLFDDYFHERWSFFSKHVLQKDCMANGYFSQILSPMSKILHVHLRGEWENQSSWMMPGHCEVFKEAFKVRNVKLFSRNMFDSRLSCRDGWSIRLCLESTKMALSSERGSESWKSDSSIARVCGICLLRASKLVISFERTSWF